MRLFIFANFEMKENKRRHNWIVLEIHIHDK